MRFRIETIPLDRIDLEDKTYHITTETTIHNIHASIDGSGLINTPLLYRHRSRYVILSGFRRISACLHLKWDEVTARIIDSTSSEIDRIRVAISDNALQRPLNLIEISRALRLLSNIFDNVNAIAKEASMLGLPKNPALIRKLKPLCQLPSSVQKAVISDAVSLPVAIELGNMAPADSAALANLFCDLKIGLNKQREIVTFIQEIAKREDLTPSDILKDSKWLEIITPENYDRSQRRQKIRQYLKQRRFPTLTRAEATFEHHKKSLHLGSHIKLTPPRHFEGDIYTFSINFRNIMELKDRVVKLERLMKHPNIDKILHE